MSAAPFERVEEQARRIGVVQVPINQAFAGAQQQSPALDALEQQRQFAAAQAAQAEVEAMQDEAEERRQEKQMAKNIRRLQMQRQMEALLNGGAAQQNDIVKELIAAQREEKTEMLQEIRALRSSGDNHITQQMMEQLKGLQEEIKHLRTPVASDPLGELIKSARALKEVQTVLDNELPKQLPVADGPLTRAQRLEEFRVTSEMKMRQAEFDAKMEESRLAREALQHDREVKMHRADRATGIIESTLGPLVAAYAGEKVPGLIGAGGGNSGAGDTLQFVCPNPDCMEAGSAPVGATSHTCEHCGFTFGLQVS